MKPTDSEKASAIQNRTLPHPGTRRQQQVGADRGDLHDRNRGGLAEDGVLGGLGEAYTLLHERADVERVTAQVREAKCNEDHP